MPTNTATTLHRKTNGLPDMRFKEAQQMARKQPIPRNIQTEKGLPDMRTSAGKAWVEQQAHKVSGRSRATVPHWVPLDDRGRIDRSQPIGEVFGAAAKAVEPNKGRQIKREDKATVERDSNNNRNQRPPTPSTSKYNDKDGKGVDHYTIYKRRVSFKEELDVRYFGVKL